MSQVEIDNILSQRKHPLAECENCPMNHRMRFRFVGTEVPRVAPSEVQAIVVGEAPGLDEILNKKPFTGPSGALMRRTLGEQGYDPTKVAYTNAVLCRPPDNKLEPYKDAIACCAPRLEHDLRTIGTDETPILAVGKESAQAVVKHTQGKRSPKAIKITERRGQWFYRNGEGRVQKDVLITVHPAYVLRVPSVLPDFQHDVGLLRQEYIKHPLHDSPSYTIVKSLDELRGHLDAIPDFALVSLDVETSNLFWYERQSAPMDRLLMIGIACGTQHAVIIPEELLFVGIELQKTVNAFFKRVRLAAHNGKFDCLWLRKYGFTAARVDFDTMLAHYTLREVPPHGLKEVAAMKYNVQPYEDNLITEYLSKFKKADRDYSLIPRAKLAQYLAWDLACTWQLAVDFEAELREEGLYEWPFLNVLMPASESFTKIERAGMLVDVPYLHSVDKVLVHDAAVSLDKLRNIAQDPEFNPRSTQQTARVMFDEFGFKPVASKHFAERSTGAPAIAQMSKHVQDHPFVTELKNYRRITKIKSSYVDKILGFVDMKGYVHANYKIMGTETGRLSASDPAIQTLPRAAKDNYGPMIRKAFCAAPGWKLVMADFSQAEMRVWAHFCQDPFLLEVYRNNRDLHTEGAIRLYGPNYNKEQRTYVKNFNFAYIYGGNEYSFAGQFNLPIEQARAFVQDYERMMPVARKWRNDVYENALKRGYVQTPFGRKRRFPLITPETYDDIRKAAWNMPIQSTASDITLLAVNQLVQEGFNVVVNVHDSIGVHCPESEAESTGRRMTEVMTGIGAHWIDSVPWVVDVDIQDRWTEFSDDDILMLGTDELETEDETEEEIDNRYAVLDLSKV